MTQRSRQHLPAELTTAGGDAFTAHPHVCSHTGRLVAFTYQMKATVIASHSQSGGG